MTQLCTNFVLVSYTNSKPSFCCGISDEGHATTNFRKLDTCGALSSMCRLPGLNINAALRFICRARSSISNIYFALFVESLITAVLPPTLLPPLHHHRLIHGPYEVSVDRVYKICQNLPGSDWLADGHHVASSSHC